MSSRVIVKNLPKRYSEDRFKAHFSQKGVVTDAKIMMTLSGESRRFGFIGFQNEKEAKAAAKYFNGTFIDTSKIAVELAKPNGDPSLPRPWSAYTKAKNVEEHQRKMILQELNKDEKDQSGDSQRTGTDFGTDAKKNEGIPASVLQTLYEETVAKSANDPRFAEFLQVMAPRAKSKTWANDDINVFSSNERKVLAKIISQKKKAFEEPTDPKKGDANTKARAKKAASKVNTSVQTVANRKPGGALLTVSKTHITFDESDDDNDSDHDSKALNEGGNISADDKNDDDFDVNMGLDDVDDKKSGGFVASTALAADLEWLKKHIKGPAPTSASDGGEKNNSDSSTSKSTSDSVSGDTAQPKKEKSNSVTLVTSDKTPAVNKIQTNLLEDISAKQKEREEMIKKIQDSGRLFVRNLPYGASENELRKYFEKYGPLSELHIPIDRESKRSKGFAYVLFVLPEHAAKAFKSSDHQFFQGRLLHVLAADEKPQYRANNTEGSGVGSAFGDTSSIKKQKAEKTKALAGSSFNWNSLYMSADAIADSISERLQISKSDLLSAESGSPAVRLALAETHIISETKTFLERNGLFLDAFAHKKAAKSDSVILVKNIPFSVSKLKTNSGFQKEREDESSFDNENGESGRSSAKTVEEEISRLFGVHGTLGRVLVPPAKTMAIVEFMEAQEARVAFKHLAYKRFGDAPLYLEWAPEKLFKTTFDPSTKHSTNNSLEGQADQNALSSAKQAPLDPGSMFEASAKIEGADADDSENAASLDRSNDGQPGRILFIKNLNFDTTEDSLRAVFEATEGLKSVVIKTRLRKLKQGSGVETLSMGFGFAEYSQASLARLAMQLLQGTEVDGHALQIKISDRISMTAASSGEQSKKASDTVNKPSTAIETAKSNKLVVKNIPFEATKSDIRELFGAYAQLKSVRLPSKFSGGHRGFAFLEFLTSQEAQNCLDQVGAGSHLYGRRLVVNWADEEPGLDGTIDGDADGTGSLEKLSGLEKLREKSTRKFRESTKNSAGTNSSNKKVRL